jgi:hypothetical protein
MDAFFIGFTLLLVMLLAFGVAAIELGVDSRPGFDGSTADS